MRNYIIFLMNETNFEAYFKGKRETFWEGIGYNISIPWYR